MILQYFTGKRNELLSLSAHFALGLFSFFSPYIFIAWFYLVMAFSVPALINVPTRKITILMLSGYILGMEILGRIIDAAPLVPYQIGTYFMIGMFGLAIFDHFERARTHVGFIMLLMCIPGFYMISSDDYLTNFLNAFAGIVCTSLGAIYFSRQTYSRDDLYRFLKAAVFPVAAILIYITLKSPSFNDMQFSLKSNDKTAGGFGSNQVSTVLGAAACFILLPYLNGRNLLGKYKWVSLILAGALLFRGLLTFSRGGVLGCLVAALLSYLYLIFTDKKNTASSLLRVLFFSLLALIIFNLTNDLTGGKLAQRYNGETGGTVDGTRTKDLKVMTSGRNEIVEAEWQIFQHNILFGVGPGNGYEARKEYVSKTVASHTEVTRLVSEQGIPGLLLAIIFLLYPVLRIMKEKQRDEKYYVIAFFSLAIITSFHSSMRTMVTPLLWGLGCASFRFQAKWTVKKRLVKDSWKALQNSNASKPQKIFSLNKI